MSKIFMGVRLRSLRQERGMTQVALAQALGISPSYLNQLEQDQRPFTVSVLLESPPCAGGGYSAVFRRRTGAAGGPAVRCGGRSPGSARRAAGRAARAGGQLPSCRKPCWPCTGGISRDTQRLHTLADRLSRVGMDEAPGWVDDALPPGQMPFEAVRDFFFLPTAITLTAWIAPPRRWPSRPKPKAGRCPNG